MKKGSVALLAEFLVVLRVDSTHGFNHFFAQLHWRRQGFGVSPKNVAKINVEQFSRGGQQEVIQMSVTNSKQVGYHTVARWKHRQMVGVIEMPKIVF
jgi:hypothetical protein